MTTDTKTMSLDFGDSENDKLREVLRRMGEFIAYFEVAEEKMVTWQQDIEQKIQEHEQGIGTKLTDIQHVADELKGIMSEAGVARWRIAAETALKQGNEHLKAVETASDHHLKTVAKNNEEFNKIVHKSFDRLDRASAYTIKNISEAVSSFRITDFQHLTERSCELVEETSRSAITRVKELLQWFHWKNLGMVFAITLFVVITTGLYLEDEMPWEIHKTVVAQRDAGQALINAWPTLTEHEKLRISKYLKRNIA